MQRRCFECRERASIGCGFMVDDIDGAHRNLVARGLSRAAREAAVGEGAGLSPRPDETFQPGRQEVPLVRDDINNALKDAMKAKDERRVSTLRLVNSTLKNADIEARGQGKEPLGDDGVLGVLQKMIKQRNESAELYDKGGRPELAQQEREEIAIISAYLPKQMSEDEVKAAIADEIRNTGAAGVKDMGKVIGALRGKYTGKMDFAKTSALVKAALSG
jgi:uncharacterized protein